MSQDNNVLLFMPMNIWFNFNFVVSPNHFINDMQCENLYNEYNELLWGFLVGGDDKFYLLSKWKKAE